MQMDDILLQEAIERYLLVCRQEKNRKAHQQLLSGGGGNKNPANPAKVSGQGIHMRRVFSMKVSNTNPMAETGC